jgi:hypothetical protein
MKSKASNTGSFWEGKWKVVGSRVELIPLATVFTLSGDREKQATADIVGYHLCRMVNTQRHVSGGVIGAMTECERVASMKDGRAAAKKRAVRLQILLQDCKVTSGR